MRGTDPGPVEGPPVVRRGPAGLAALCGVALLLVVGWPDAWAVNRAMVSVYLVGLHAGIPPSVTPEHWGALLNVVLFVPATALVLLALPRLRWWWVLAAAVAGSVLIEVAQGLSGLRQADPVDVLTNTLGAALGCVLGLCLRRRYEGRDRARRDVG